MEAPEFPLRNRVVIGELGEETLEATKPSITSSTVNTLTINRDELQAQSDGRVGQLGIKLPANQARRHKFPSPKAIGQQNVVTVDSLAMGALCNAEHYIVNPFASLTAMKPPRSCR